MNSAKRPKTIFIPNQENQGRFVYSIFLSFAEQFMRQLTSICIATLLLFQAQPCSAETVTPSASSATSATSATSSKQSVSPTKLPHHLDAMAATYYKPNAPGATVIVVKNGKSILRKGYGLASVVENRAMQADDVMRLGSVSKQFTAVAILMLMEEGKLALSDNLLKFFPDYPASGKKITVEHLLTHTAGIPNYTSKPGFFATVAKDMGVDEMIATFKNDTLEFEPGSAWSYSNSGYFLLGAIIEKVSGLTYASFVEQRIFVPLGMNNSAYEGFERSKQSRAAGHAPGPQGFKPSEIISMTQPYAAGALSSTVGDLAIWDSAIEAGKLLKGSSWKRAFTPYILSSGEKTGYGYGWAIGELEGTSMISHTGGIDGFSTFALRLPKEKVYVAVLSNAEAGLPSSYMVGSRLAAWATGKPLPEFKAITLQEKVLDQFVGVYKLGATTRRYFFREGNTLVMSGTSDPKTILQPYAANRFFEKVDTLLRVEFVRNAQGGMAARVYQHGNVKTYERTNNTLP
jgi:D-alanyl-D-alanine carboxypeptidase